MNKIKVLHLTFDMAIGGTEQVIRNLMENTDLDRFDPAILCLESPVGAFGEKLREQGFSVEAYSRSAGLDFQLIKKIRATVRERGIHVLHCHQYTPYIYGLFASLGTKATVIFTEHGRFYPDRFKWKRVLLNPLLSLATDAITSISRATKEALVTFENFPRNKIDVVYNGINDKRYREEEEPGLREGTGLKEGDIVLGTIARLDPIKNQKLMISSLKKVRDSFPRTKLLIVGDGPIREELEIYTREQGLESEVIYTGFQVESHKYLQLMDVFLLSSLSEGTSMTLLEAMASCKPCVVTEVGGNPEIIKDGVNGWVTPSDDSDAFAEAIIRLLEEEGTLRKMGEAGRKRFDEHFTAQKMVESYQGIYQKIVKS